MDITALYHTFLACNGVTTDSRHCPEGSLFIALKGDTFNGNQFAAKALEAGCAHAVVDEAQYASTGDPRYTVVENGLQALQLLARHHRRQMNTRLIGITGTNGKTTTKELMAAVLSQSYHVLYTEGNLNNHIGVPLTLLRLRPEHQIGIIEMGASHPGDIRELAEIAEPDYGLITNVGKAHLEGFGSLEGVIQTKGELYDFLRKRQEGTIFLHSDNPHLKQMSEGLSAVRYGESEETYVQGKFMGCAPFLSFEWKSENSTTVHRVQTRLIGGYNFTNALAAVTVGCFFDVNPELIDKALSDYTPGNNRSQWKQTANNALIIDAYNANPTSMAAAIENFQRMQAKAKMLILGDMLELGKESAEEHQRIADLLQSCGFENVLLVGSAFAAATHPYPTCPDTASAIALLETEKPCGKTILIKGSHGLRLDKLAPYL